jgi:cytochrome c biogenesis protein CcmG, thiol:disulfide interchange protein DsbE
LAGCGSAAPEVPASRPCDAPATAKGGLARLRAEAGRLLDGGPGAFRARLVELRGHPVVVNHWASWCDPCRFEFPFFRDQADKLKGRVAFLGVNSEDSRSDASAFLKELPVPFPHFYDRDATVARVFRGGRAWPTTAFYNTQGRLVFTHQGAYATEAKLAEDIQEYALGD